MTFLPDRGFEQGETVLEVERLEVEVRLGRALARAVTNVTFDVHAGEVLGIVGESGSGKSLTASSILGLLPRGARAAGSVRFKGQEILGASERDLMKIRGAGIAAVLQDPLSSLNPVYSVGWQIEEALRAHGRTPRRRASDRAASLLGELGIPEPRAVAARYPHELSGGMRQRVVIAMAMANDPDVILADEPTSALDVTVQAQVLESLRRATSATGASLVLITHDLGVLASMAQRVMVMYAGRSVEIGSVEDIFYRPAMPYTIGLLSSLPRPDASERSPLRAVAGRPPSLSERPPGCAFASRCPLATPRCRSEEPELEPVGERGHSAACHRWQEVSSSSIEDLFPLLARPPR